MFSTTSISPFLSNSLATLTSIAALAMGCGARSDLPLPEPQDAASPFSGIYDLRIHRVMMGFDRRFHAGLQRSLVMSTATRGILEREGHLDSFRWREVFTLPGGMTLRPESGEVEMGVMATPFDSDFRNPALPSEVRGIRMYNALGSQPPGSEYFAQCWAALGNACSFFYFFMNDAVVPLGGPVAPGRGRFHSATGEMTFRDVELRIVSPFLATISTSTDIEGRLRLALTTGCVTEDLIPDVAAREMPLVPPSTLAPSGYDATLLPENPLVPYVGGPHCQPGQLHGRPMSEADTTHTLEDVPLRQSFDLAGVGRMRWNMQPGVLQSAQVYLILKAELVARN